MSATAPDPYGLKHRPVFLLPYEAFDGPYASNTDCKYLSVGWAQYDPRSASVKTLRHTGGKWSRQSEELPIHRAIDAALMIALAVEVTGSQQVSGLPIPAGTFENQSSDLNLTLDTESPAELRSFRRELTDQVVLNRLSKLREVLNRLHREGEIT